AERRRRASADERRAEAQDAKDAATEDTTTAGDDDPLGAPATRLSALSVARFRIPPFLLPIYQAAGVQYGIRWEVLAAINEVETDYGRNLNVSSAGALGWMQFMPATWAQYGLDANGDRDRDPYNPVDAIFAAARYLRAAGGETDLRRAIFAYNHAGWYVDDVLGRARAIAALPADVVGSLTGLTLAQMPVFAPDEGRAGADRRARDDRPTGGRGADDHGARADDDVRLRATGSSDWSAVVAPEGTKAVAVQDATVVRLGRSAGLGRYVELRDAYGNRYTYAHLDALAGEHVVPRRHAADEGAGPHERREERRDATARADG
ncbi:lytic murein transglycosylase, partial [Patulibacter sp. S7RM1-6]